MNALSLVQRIYNPQLIEPLRNFTAVDYANRLIPVFINVGYIICILAFFLLLIFGGIQWTTSGGSKEKLEGARSKIINAVTGLFVLFALWVILKTINVVFGINLGNVGVPIVGPTAAVTVSLSPTSIPTGTLGDCSAACQAAGYVNNIGRCTMNSCASYEIEVPDNNMCALTNPPNNCCCRGSLTPAPTTAPDCNSACQAVYGSISSGSCVADGLCSGNVVSVAAAVCNPVGPFPDCCCTLPPDCNACFDSFQRWVCCGPYSTCGLWYPSCENFNSTPAPTLPVGFTTCNGGYGCITNQECNYLNGEVCGTDPDNTLDTCCLAP